MSSFGVVRDQKPNLCKTELKRQNGMPFSSQSMCKTVKLPEHSCNYLEGVRSYLELEKDHFEAVILLVGSRGLKSVSYS